jgi:two-component system chemotaxis sensor kinase CheA
VDAVVFEEESGAPGEAELAASQPAPGRGHDAARAEHVRVERSRLDDMAEGIGELAVLHARMQPGVTNAGAVESLGRMGTVLAELQRALLAMRMVPLSDTFERLPRVVRDAARVVGKDVELRIEGGDIEVDRSIADEAYDPLVHILRNAVDHGLENNEDRLRAGKPARGRLLVRAVRERGAVRIDANDDGRGVDIERVVTRAKQRGLLRADAPPTLPLEDVFRLLSSPGFSTSDRVTEVSGRGVGLDAVLARVRALGGAIGMSSAPGAGTTFTMHLPITIALAQVLRVRVGGEHYAVPLTHVREAVELDGVMLAAVGGRESVRIRDDLLPLVRLRKVLQVRGAGEERAAVIAEIGDRRAALAVDELVGREQILIKSFQAPASTLPIFSGATLLADGRPALILDPLSVL